MSFYVSACLVCCTMVLSASGQVPGFGACPEVPVKQDFKLAQYAGKWYEVERYWPIFFELGTKCGQAVYTDLHNGHIKVENKGYNRITGEITTVTGDAYAPNATVPAKLIVTFPQAGVFATGNYWVLDTDYSSYSVVYSCSGLDHLAHADIVWILGREKTLPADVLTDLHQKITNLGLRTKFLIDPPQKDCPFQKEDKLKYRVEGNGLL